MGEEKNKKFITQREYAKHRGCHLSVVIAALKSQRISTSPDEKGRPRIDWEKCDIDWKNNTDESLAITKRKTKKVGSKVAKKIIPKAGEAVKKPLEQGVVYAVSRAKKEEYNAKIKQLEFEEKSGSLVKRDDIIKTLQTLAHSIKEQLRTIPQKTSAELAAETDPRNIEIYLLKEIDRALEGLEGLKEKI